MYIISLPYSLLWIYTIRKWFRYDDIATICISVLNLILCCECGKHIILVYLKKKYEKNLVVSEKLTTFALAFREKQLDDKFMMRK